MFILKAIILLMALYLVGVSLRIKRLPRGVLEWAIWITALLIVIGEMIGR